jgi:pilus assembly protein CpaF
MGEPAFRDCADPADLPLFAPVPASRSGRIRSTFSLRTDPIAARDDVDASPASPATLLVRNPPHGWHQPHPAGRLGTTGVSVDWTLVARLRTQASDRLSASLGDGQRHLDREAQQEIGRAIIAELLRAEAQERLSAGLGAWATLEQDAVGKAIFDALFGLGRLQPLVDDDRTSRLQA